MDFLFSRINKFIFFVLVIYSIPITAGRPKKNIPINPTKDFTLRIHHDCYSSIIRIFTFPIETANWREEYFRYGVQYLRHATIQETVDYIERQFNETGEEPLDLYLIYNGEHGKIYNEEFAYEYFNYYSNRFEEPTTEYHPYAFCTNNPVFPDFVDDVESCKYTLEKFGFVKGNMTEVFEHLYSNIVFNDIENHNFTPDPNKPLLDISYASTYFMALNGNTKLTMLRHTKRPEEFCLRNYTEDRQMEEEEQYGEEDEEQYGEEEDEDEDGDEDDGGDGDGNGDDDGDEDDDEDY